MTITHLVHLSLCFINNYYASSRVLGLFLSQDVFLSTDAKLQIHRVTKEPNTQRVALYTLFSSSNLLESY